LESRYIKYVLTVLVISILITCAFTSCKNTGNHSSDYKCENIVEYKPKIGSPKVFADSFSYTESLEETGKMSTSKNTSWWLNSGGLVGFENCCAKTVQGELPESNIWRKRFASANPGETDNGFHPQNIFRLVLRSKWQNLDQQAYFKINADNLSASSYRKESNGLFLLNRYIDGNNLYYTGIRVDGAAVIKKKKDGKYCTISHKPVFNGAKYDRASNPNLLPKNTWIGMRSVVENTTNGATRIKLYLDIDRTGKWDLALDAVDDGERFDGKPLSSSGYTGIRTDFMDVELTEYRIEEIR
jgi:hypothetical protein